VLFLPQACAFKAWEALGPLTETANKAILMGQVPNPGFAAIITPSILDMCSNPMIAAAPNTGHSTPLARKRGKSSGEHAMKKLLLASVATLAVAAFAAGQVQAADSNDGLKLTLGGYYSAQGAYGWQNDGAGQPGHNVEKDGIFTYGEVSFNAEKTFDNGLTAGYKGVLELPVSNGAGTVPTTVVRQDFGYFSGNWGRFELGENYSPLYYMSMGAPAVNDEFDSIDPDFALANITGAAATQTGATTNVLGAGNYATVGFTPFYKLGSSSGLLDDKVVYYTPRFNGFQVGGSFTPSANRTGDGTQSATGGFVANNTVAAQDQRLEVAASYDSSLAPIGLAGVGLKASGGYGHAQLEDNGASNGLVANSQLKDEQSWIAGAQLAYLGWTVGGGYLWDNNGMSFHDAATGLSANGESNIWNVGLGYELGPYHAGVTYYQNDTDTIHTTTTTFKSTDKLNRWVLGGGYKVAPGVDLETTLQFHKYETADSGANPLGNNNATILTVGTTVNF